MLPLRPSGLVSPALMITGLKVHLVFFLLFSAAASASDSPYCPAMLHPADSFTAYTLKKNQWVFNIPFSPGWAMWGVTDNITVELDAECWLGGVPSMNGRFRLQGQTGTIPAIALETMYQFLPDTVNLLEHYDYLNVRRTGNSWYNRANFSWRLSPELDLGVSPGVTYSETVVIDNGTRSVFRRTVSEDVLRGDISLGLHWQTLSWLSLHASLSHGATFVYLDNVPGKDQLAAGARISPFCGREGSVLRNLGAEIAIVSISFPEVDETLTGPMMYLFWQTD